MSGINALTTSSGNYYSLAGQGTTSHESKTGKTSASLTSSLLATLAEDETANSADTAVQVKLSAAAQAYLAKMNGTTSSSTSTTSFSLTKQQAQKIDDILAKYKDSPFTQTTFEKIQDELKAAGLSADQLRVKDQVSSFNPTQSLISALNGTDGETAQPTAATRLAESQSKAEAYMKNIITAWKSISTTVGES